MEVKDYLHDRRYNGRADESKVADEKERSGKVSKKKMAKDADFIEANKNKDLVMQIYKVQSSVGKSLDDGKKKMQNRINLLSQKIMSTAFDREPKFRAVFSNQIIGTGLEMKVELTDANTYEVRLFTKAFPFPGAFSPLFGQQYKVPHGCAVLAVSKDMGRVEKMMIKSEWANVMDGDVISPGKMLPWFIEGIVKAVRAIQMDDDDPDKDKLQIMNCSTGVELLVLPEDEGDNSENKNNVVTHVKYLITVKGTGLPKGMRLQHPLPGREPYVSEGKAVIDRMYSEINEGQSLYHLDACVLLGENNPNTTGSTGHWLLNLRHMSEQVVDCARNFGKTNMIDPTMLVAQLMSSTKGWNIPSTIIETAILWEYKKNANNMKNEAKCLSNTLLRLHGYFTSGSCPHFLLPNFNMLKNEDAEWCDIIARELGEAIAALDEEPGSLQTLTGTTKKKRHTQPDAEQKDEKIDYEESISSQ